MMKKVVKEFFFLRKGERRALFLVVLMVCSSVIVRILVANREVPTVEVDDEILLLVSRFREELESAREEKLQQLNSKPAKTDFSITVEDELSPFPFDPNKISYDSLKLMNISDYISGNIVRYRKAGGMFRNSEDLMKIYGMEETVYEVISPYVTIVSSETIRNTPKAEKPLPIPEIHLNEADSSQLMLIPGIGPYFSGRILKYREMLGGYYDYQQLWEVYGMDTFQFKAIKEYTLLDTAEIRRINLNRATFRELISHPYLNKSETYTILQYRDYVDSIESVSDLEINQIIDHERFMRIAPYLEVNSRKD